MIETAAAAPADLAACRGRIGKIGDYEIKSAADISAAGSALHPRY